MGSPIFNALFSGIRLNTSGKAIYLQLADSIQAFIRSGKLPAGYKLPASRELAVLLNINRLTISKAYQELELQGWLESHVGKGTFVASHLPELQPTPLKATSVKKTLLVSGFGVNTKPYFNQGPVIVSGKYHLDDGFPDPALAPLKELYRAYRSQLTRGSLYNKYGSYSYPGGSFPFKKALSAHLNQTRGLRTTEDNILTVRGTVMAINLVCNGLIEPGDIIAAGIPGWGRAETNFIHAGAKLLGIPVDENGLIVDELKKICKRKKVRMVYVTPHHHYPTTVSLRMDRRLELLRLSEEYGFIIFEDDYDFDFHYKRKPLLPLASADEQGMVIYCGSFSKTFSPAFRLGYLAASQNVVEHLSRVRLILDRQGDHILENAMAELLNDGTIQRSLRKTVSVYQERRDHFCDLLTSHLSHAVEFNKPEGGMTVWTKFDKGINLEKLAALARKNDLFFSDGRSHQYPSFKENATRLGFASSGKDELDQSVLILKKLIGRI